MKNGDAIAVDEVTGEVSVVLCEECTELGKRMAMEYDTSPLPECDAEQVSYECVDETSGLVSGAGGECDTEKALKDALRVVKAHEAGLNEHLPDSRVVEARIVVLSAKNLGLLEDETV